MNKRLFCALLLLLPFFQSFPEVASHLVLAEIYGGGGDQGSYWTNDYIVLYNPIAIPIDLSDWSVQYAKFNGSSWEVTNLSGLIPAFGYYIIQEGGGNRGIAPLPFTPNAIGNIDIDKNKGKVALVNSQAALTVSNPIGEPNVIDFVGYGNGTNAYEGSGPAPQLGITSSVRRLDNNGNNTYGTNGNGWDSNDNKLDLYFEPDIVTVPPLPVELSYFSAKIFENGIILFWRTETEVNNYGFDVERTSPYPSPYQGEGGEAGRGWVSIGFIEGSGNSNSPKEYSFFDDKVLAGTYSYRLKQIDTDGDFEYSKVVQVDFNLPENFELYQNYPNPFNPSTTISFCLPQSTNVKVSVYNLIGEKIDEIVNGFLDAGIHQFIFDASNLHSGMYLYKLEARNISLTKKMILIK